MSLTIILGPMFAGKSSELHRCLQRSIMGGSKCLLIKHAWDKRYASGKFTSVTHSKVSFPCISANKLENIPIEKYDVIGIDEGQFFSDLVSFTTSLLFQDKTVFIASLDGDADMNVFGHTLELIPKANAIKKLTAICVGCGDEAPFTKKLSGKANGQVDVGAADKYVATCRSCHLDQTNTGALKKRSAELTSSLDVFLRV